MIAVTTIAETRKTAADVLTDRLDVTGQARKKSIKVIFMPLIEWKSTASTRPNSSTWTA